MVRTLAHRGPDDEHVVAGERFALAARRLSILDLDHGRQPLANEDGTVVACQNGELYNYPTLRPELASRGHVLTTGCDTEVLPHLYEEHGTALPERIDGMFAVAVWDDRNQVGLLARDRMGKKPLYYHLDRGVLYFASEIKAMLAIPGFRRRVDLAALHHYLGYKHVPHPLSIFEGVRILPPGHLLVYRPGQAPEVRRYWAPDFSPDPEAADLPEEALVDRLLALLRRGVERRLMADVPVGFFLSGGIDSSLSTVLAAELCPQRVRTFCLTYEADSTHPGKELDRQWARWVAERWGTEHHEETVRFSRFPDAVKEILRHFDEPFAGVVSTYFLSQLISRHVKVALSGDAADELFGSYLSHRLAFPLANYETYRQTGDSSLTRPFEEQPEFLARLAGKPDWEWRADLLVLTDAEKRDLYSPEVAAELAGTSTAEHLREAFAGLTAQDPLNRILEMEFRTVFPDQVLTFVDRLSMAHSLEVRTAYLDTDFVEFVTHLPGRWKIHDGETKYLLKQAARRYFPEEMVRRPKEGFLMPITQWILNDLEEYVRDTLAPERLRRHGFFDASRVRALIDRLYQGGADYRAVNKVYALLIFQEWYDLYLG